MVTENEAWDLEERLWLEGPSVYEDLLSSECVMAFPAPVGILQGAGILSSLEGAPRWSTVTMSEKRMGRPDRETLVLGYRAEGRRTGSETYVAYCTSSYRLDRGEWKLIQHQQTPVSRPV